MMLEAKNDISTKLCEEVRCMKHCKSLCCIRSKETKAIEFCLKSDSNEADATGAGGIERLPVRFCDINDFPQITYLYLGFFQGAGPAWRRCWAWGRCAGCGRATSRPPSCGVPPGTPRSTPTRRWSLLSRMGLYCRNWGWGAGGQVQGRRTRLFSQMDDPTFALGVVFHDLIQLGVVAKSCLRPGLHCVWRRSLATSSKIQDMENGMLLLQGEWWLRGAGGPASQRPASVLGALRQVLPCGFRIRIKS